MNLYDNRKLKAYEYFVHLCKDSLKKFPTTLEQDIQILSNKNLSFNYKNSVIQRKGEKRLLSFYIKYFSLMIDYHLENKKANRQKIIKQIKKLCTSQKAFSFGEELKIFL